MGATYTATLTVAAPGAAAWREVQFFAPWAYDSMIVWMVSSSANVQAAYDSDTPWDAYYTVDSGVTWGASSLRPWIRLEMQAQTVGDLPVSGTVNNVPIPAVGTEAEVTAISCPASVETTLKTVAGAGYCQLIHIEEAAAADSDHTQVNIYCDGTLAWYGNFAALNTEGYTASTPGVSLLKYAVDGFCVVLLTARFEFQRELKVTAIPNATGAQLILTKLTLNLIK